MKKSMIISIIFILFILIIANIAFAQETDNANSPSNLDDTQNELKDISGNIQKSSNEFLSTEMKIPENIAKGIKIIFRLSSEDKINMQLGIILICILALFILIIHNIVQFAPSFDTLTSWLVAIVFVLILSATGAIKSVAMFLLGIGNIFGALERWGPLKLGLGVIAIIIIYYISSLIIGVIKETVIMGRAVSDGIKAGSQIAKLKAMAEIEKISEGKENAYGGGI
ncbi:MAG: hypothetical protein AABX30_00665 [Nanoarchaeota archaeon]